MRVDRANSYGADQWIDLIEAMIRVSASLESFENRLLLMFPETEILKEAYSRRYTIFSSPVAAAKQKLASVYVSTRPSTP